MSEIVMPRLTDSMEEGVILAWLKSDGDEVAVGDELVEIETDKASMVYESDLAGTLQIVVPEGETRPIGETIAHVGEGSPAAGREAAGEESEAGEEPAASEEGPPEDTDSGRETTEPSDAGDADESAAARPDPDARIKVSPLARRMAAEKGLDLSGISGSGPGGRIIKVDIERAGEGAAPVARADERSQAPSDSARGRVETVEIDRTQQLIARRMSEAKATIPHFYLRTTVNMDRVLQVRQAFKEAAEGGPVPSLNDFVVKAAALALKRHPRANGAFRDGSFELYERVNVGIAVAAENALIVPVITDADQRSLASISERSRELAGKVRDREITPPELAGGTFSVSNLGMFGVSGFDAVINPGQAGILSVGEVARKPVATDDGFEAANLMEITLACDHRILYGADGAEFLATVKALLEEPGLLA